MISKISSKVSPNNKPVGVAIIIILLIVLGTGVYFLISHALRMTRQPGILGDPPLSEINRFQPIAAQMTDTMARTSAIQALKLFDNHRHGTGLYPNSVMCSEVIGKDFLCEIPELENFRNGYAIMYARAMAIRTLSEDNRERDRERREQAYLGQWEALRRDLAAYIKLSTQSSPPLIQNSYYICAFLAPVSTLTGLTDEEREVLLWFCSMAIYEGFFSPSEEVSAEHALDVHQKLQYLTGASGTNDFDWSQDKVIAMYREGETFYLENPSLHAVYVTDIAAMYFWADSDVSSNFLNQRIHGYFSFFLSDYYFAQSGESEIVFSSNDILTGALATQRMIEIYEHNGADTALLRSFRNMLLLDFHRYYFSDLDLANLPLAQLADLAFAYDQLTQVGAINNRQDMSRLIAAVINRISLSNDGEISGFTDAFERGVEGGQLASFNLLTNGMLAAFILNNYWAI